MEDGSAGLVLTLSVLLLVGLGTEVVGWRLRVPRVTLLILAGMIAGAPGLDVLPVETGAWYPVVSKVALVMVGFLLGRNLALPLLRARGTRLIWFSACAVLGAALLVGGLLVAAGAPLPLALVLAGVAPASAPAAIMNVVEEAGARGSYTRTMLSVVAVNNVVGLVVFDILLAGAEMIANARAPAGPLLSGAQSVGGALLAGALLALPTTLIVRHVRSGEPMQVAALGLILACGALALWLGASYLLAAITMGAVLVNVLKSDSRPFDTVEAIDWPVMVLFFVLTGASAHPEKIATIGTFGALYVVGRVLGLLGGAWLGGALGRAPDAHRRWLGPAIQPQAGVALGMALTAGAALPQWEDTIMAVVVGSTVLFELVGPVFTRLALVRTGELDQARAPEQAQ